MDQPVPSPRIPLKLLDRARRALHSPAAPLLLAALVLLMSLPSLGLGLQLDDRTYMRLFAEGRDALNLLYEAPQDLLRERRLGVFAWWAGPQFAIHFLRPLSAFTHQLEFMLWPHAAWAMHLANCCLYALLVAVAAFAYRALLPSAAAAGLAALMFAVDDSHAQSVGWIASRHTILSSLFALSALCLHVRSRKQSSAALRLASVACTALTLLASEYGAASLAYLLAYALVFEQGTRGARLRSIWPHASVALAWLATYFALGCGVHDASWFRDPRSAPFDTLLQGLADTPLWLLSQLGGDTANVALVLPQAVARLLALLFFLPVLALLVPVLFVSQNARFCATGMLLSLVPLFATVPQDRLLLAASFGGFGWIACVITELSEHASAFMRTGAHAFKIPHLIIAPMAFIPIMGGLSAIDATSQALAEAVPAHGATQAIVINLPLELLTNTAASSHDASAVPLHQLYAGFSKLKVRRTDARTLEIAAEGGWGTRPLERMFSARRSMPKLHEVRALPDLRATVIAVDGSGLPTRVRFVFPDALERPGRAWLVWKGKRPAPWKPPAIGAEVTLEAPSMLGLVF